VELLLTQEFIANMLGGHRESVTKAAGRLQKAGLIRYVRGHITILDRKGLEAASCECYQVVKTEFDRLLGYGRPSRRGVWQRFGCEPEPRVWGVGYHRTRQRRVRGQARSASRQRRLNSFVASATGESRYARPWVSSPANEGLKSAAASAAKKPVLNPQRISDGAFLERVDLPTGTYVAFLYCR
jgi:hypothetical protein